MRGVIRQESPRSADDGEPTAAIAPEPECEADGAASKAIPLRLFAVADMAKPECDDSAINFRPTMMFQTRAFTFPLRNTSTAQMDFKWAVCTLDGEPEADSIYEVRPEGGVVEAGGSVDVTVRFKPVEVVDARRLLIASIPHMPEDAQALSRPLNGRILRPWCHFEMPESDYLSSGRRNPDMKGPEGDLGPLDPATRVVEYESLGTKVRNTKRFFVLNPTSMSYEFFWGPQKVEGGKAAPVGPFRCLTPRGVCQSGKRYEMAFEYTPEDDEVTEGFWEFRIPDQGITVPFLMVGHVKEPRVALDRPGVHFGKVLVGTNITETMHIINSENIPFSFAFDKSTYEASRERIESTGAAPVVQFSPADGTVMANSSLPIQVSYRPALEKLTNYNVVMTVRKKPTRLALNVKGEGYLIHEVVTVDTSEGGAVELDPAVPNSVDFGQVIINQRVVKNVSIVNSGEISYDFEWRVGENPKVSIKPEVGTVPKGERVVCELVYHSHGTDVMDHYPVSLKILNGNKYALRLSGVAHRPKLNFSFVSHDFGPTFLAEPGLDPSQVVLLARNDDVQEVSFDCMFEGTDAFTLACSPTVLTPGESKTMAVQFHPSTAGKYAEVASFEVNGLYSINVSLTGEGVPMKVEVAPPSGPVCNFGSAKQGSAVSRTVHLRNASKVPARLSLAPMAEVLERYNVEAVPAGELLIKPRETAQLALYFRPQTRTRPFSEDFNVTVAGAARQLFRIQGACLGTELTFATDSIPFPPVVHGSRAVKRLQVENTGDVGTKFTWDTKKFGPNFSIFPAEGFLAPSQDTRLEVTFHPGRVDSDMRVERIRCKVEGGEDRFLTLTGSCVEQDGDATEVRFECAVRASVKQTVSIHNTSTTLAWQLQPVFRHDAWSGSEFLSVPPGKKADYTITFHPVSMSSAESPTEGSLFFPLPDGSGLLYKLVGVAGPPAPEGELALDVTAKSRFSGVLPVHNWLPQPQRFKVTIDKGGGDPATTLSGAEHIDVPNLSEREYRYAFYAFKEGVTEATVTFTNEVTGEYLFYKLAFKAGPPGLRGSLSLGCAVRQVTSQMIRLENPLETGVTMSGKSSDAQLSVPGSVEVPAGGSRTVEVSYRPLLVGERTASVAFECAELGLFQYEVALQGVPTGPETGLAFGVPLGSSEVQSFRFRHWLPDKADYACKFRNGGANGCFTVQSTAAAPPAEGAEGVEVEVSVTFEPTTISENFSDLLIVEHAAGGRYECPVKGRAEGPRPQGPVEIAGSSASVSHKNVFLQDATFHFSCDNPAFTVKPSELIKSKQSVNVNIAFKEQPGLPRTGKLTIACPDQTPSPWVYYLRA
jgi:hydrocephalus-inducing protein